MGTESLSEFLLARIAEDEAIARQWPADREPPPNGDALWIDALGHPIYQPRARVLAECESKRRIVGWFASVSERVSAAPALEPRQNELGMVLRALALPYADHADYRQEWRP